MSEELLSKESRVQQLQTEIAELEKTKILDRGQEGLHFTSCQLMDGTSDVRSCNCGGAEDHYRGLVGKRIEFSELTDDKAGIQEWRDELEKYTPPRELGK